MINTLTEKPQHSVKVSLVKQIPTMLLSSLLIGWGIYYLKMEVAVWGLIFITMCIISYCFNTWHFYADAFELKKSVISKRIRINHADLRSAEVIETDTGLKELHFTHIKHEEPLNEKIPLMSFSKKNIAIIEQHIAEISLKLNLPSTINA
ncbi:hypothetical protein [Pseudoalteromonas spongiae]|uniref:hypothetical protein n=1 Tax=Pseudoalteromonas spongiae TaxID=298657 RepID=UPI003734C67F